MKVGKGKMKYSLPTTKVYELDSVLIPDLVADFIPRQELKDFPVFLVYGYGGCLYLTLFVNEAFEKEVKKKIPIERHTSTKDGFYVGAFIKMPEFDIPTNGSIEVEIGNVDEGEINGRLRKVL